MNLDSLVVLIGVEGNGKTYIVSRDSRDLCNNIYVDCVYHNKDNVHFPYGEFAHVQEAVYSVLGAEMDANDGQERSYTIKAFKQFERIDIGRAWVIKFDTQSGEYNVSTEVDGFKGKSPCGVKGINDVITLNSLNTAVDFVSFLEKVYTESNSNAGKKTTTLGAIYDKSQKIMAKPFDTASLKLFSPKEIEYI